MTGPDTLSAILCRMVDEIPPGEPISTRARLYADGRVIDEQWVDPAAGIPVSAVLRGSARMAKIIAAYRAEGHRVKVEYWFPGLPAATSAVWFDGTVIAAQVPPAGLATERG